MIENYFIQGLSETQLDKLFSNGIIAVSYKIGNERGKVVESRHLDKILMLLDLTKEREEPTEIDKIFKLILKVKPTKRYVDKKTTTYPVDINRSDYDKTHPFVQQFIGITQKILSPVVKMPITGTLQKLNLAILEIKKVDSEFLFFQCLQNPTLVLEFQAIYLGLTIIIHKTLIVRKTELIKTS